jgi:molybdopterin-guanine dinucleotide biosynthesis protein B
MKVIGFCGASGAGKTTLIEGVIAGFKAAGQRVSVVKHTHKRFDIDHAGKDSFRHREAGAYEVVIANGFRMAKVREYEEETEPTAHRLLAELAPCDWALVEGFRHAELKKIEVWREGVGREAMYPTDPHVIGVATDHPARLPAPTLLPVYLLDQADDLVQALLAMGDTLNYQPPAHATPAPSPSASPWPSPLHASPSATRHG